MPENCTIVKEMKCRGYGAKVLNKGHNLAEVGQNKRPLTLCFVALEIILSNVLILENFHASFHARDFLI